ncbi:MAG TPA: hypothetical protein VF058_01820 [Actinomycetota bacterium]
MGRATDLSAVLEGRAYAELLGWRIVEVSGADARAWLHDLLMADVASLSPARARRALMLKPTGHIRADLTVASRGDGFLLVQDPRQPTPIDLLLAPYVLSADVRLEDRSDRLRAVAFPERPAEGADAYAPSASGPGHDVILAREAVVEARGAQEVGLEAIEVWRIARGEARFPQDLGDRSLPNEAGLEALIEDAEKGCFLGQEAVAKTRTLGRPPFAVIRARAGEPVEEGQAVRAGDDEVGEVTSAAEVDGGWALIARVRWSSREGPLTVGDRAIEVRGLATG